MIQKSEYVFIIFLNSQFNTSSAPSDGSSDHLDECIGYSEVGSNQGSSPEFVLFYGIFFLCLSAPSLNNADMSLAHYRH